MKNTISMQTIGVQQTVDYVAPTKFETLQLNLPNSHTTTTDVRSIHCGGTFFVVRPWSSNRKYFAEELYVKFTTPSPRGCTHLQSLLGSSSSSDSSESSDTNPFYLLDYRSAIDRLDFVKCYQIENVYCTQAYIILQMENNLLLGFGHDTEHAFYCKKFMDDGIREITCGPLSFQILVCGNDGMGYYFRVDAPTFLEDEKFHLDFTKRKYITAAVSGRSTFVVYENEDGSHHILSHGDDQFRIQSGQPSEDKFSELETPFDGRRIHQIKCGYFHTCVLLEDGDVYTCGYNAYGQCGVPGPDQNFIKVIFPSFPLQPTNDHFPAVYEGSSTSNHKFQPTRIICSSIATLFCNKDGFMIIGDPVTAFSPKYQFFPSVDCIYYAFNQKMKSSLYTQTVECGGWHVVIYNKKVVESKSMIYFYDNLKKIITETSFSDIQIK
ncbi:predicted protein [Naegleria gruberi]|uniref:Predicted protein n=1 Tax=Naegleria gruberi TaxID=5762 RepID=D2VH91_NAEGR|nr:uncharacterized protein NAEGRDRAFT_68131 [Naegleria gruberi]EFC43758.1 predicted protein [Naegleria gruberi]|eukprot:XP_002676502.1 predicted protein [Naegleria gruberi strain NEG-M]